MKDLVVGSDRDGPAASVIWAAGLAGIAVIGALDYFTGIELRVYPLYYGPIALLAWRRGRVGAVTGTVLSGMAWVVANTLAGQRYSTDVIAVSNTITQSASFLIVGLLIATLRDALAREHGLSRTDPLTSMLNTRAFHDDAVRALGTCRRSGRPVTVAYIDLDDFKSVNDRLGHRAGDDLLRRVAGRLGASVRPGDVAARVGGDEFVVLFPDIGPREAALTMERVRTALFGDPTPGISPIKCSIGAVTYLRPPDRVDSLIQRADREMYVAKTAGKDRVALAVVE
ncbi:MAG: GGDEF domain-containing protein [Gemmatimonadales bacterium]